LPSSPAQDFYNPDLFNVKTEVKADDSKFIPKYEEDSAVADLFANPPADVNGQKVFRLPYRSSVLVDCGFEVELPNGYKATITAHPDFAARGLIVPESPRIIKKGRVQVPVINVGKEIIVIQEGDSFARMSLEPVYMFDWIVGELV
jgi:dUTPase